MNAHMIPELKIGEAASTVSTPEFNLNLAELNADILDALKVAEQVIDSDDVSLNLGMLDAAGLASALMVFAMTPHWFSEDGFPEYIKESFEFKNENEQLRDSAMTLMAGTVAVGDMVAELTDTGIPGQLAQQLVMGTPHDVKVSVVTDLAKHWGVVYGEYEAFIANGSVPSRATVTLH